MGLGKNLPEREALRYKHGGVVVFEEKQVHQDWREQEEKWQETC